MYRVSNAQHNKGKTGDVYGLSELILMDLLPCPQIDLLPSSLFWVSDVKDCFLFGSALQDDVVLAVVLPSFSSPKDPSLELVLGDLVVWGAVSSVPMSFSSSILKILRIDAVRENCF